MNSMNSLKILVMMIISIMILSALTIPAGEAQGGEREFKQVHINLKADDKLGPEFEHDNETEPQKKRVHAKYDQYPGTRANREWVDVGTWISEGLDGSMTLDSGQFTFNIWFQVMQSDYNANADWEFHLYHNDGEIASASVTNSDESKDHPVEVRASGNIGSPVDAQVGDTFKIYIRYQAWEDCDVYYDTMEYDSGGVGSMDSIHILEAKGSVEARFFDAFGINWDTQGKYFCNVNTGDSVVVGDANTEIRDGGAVEGANGTTYQTTKINFKDIDVQKGTNVVVMISYGLSDSSEGWTITYTAGSEGSSNGDDDDDLPIAAIGGVSAVVVVLGGVLAYLFIFKKRGEEYEDDEEYEEYEEDEEYEDEEEE